MVYDFDKLTERRGTRSMKWNVKENELPMWVADMDFETAPEIIKALKDRAGHGIFGYTETDREWENAYISWWKERHAFEIKREWLVFSTGVIPTISSTVRKLTTPNENVVMLTPIYNTFFNCIVNNGARVLECPLTYENDTYVINYGELEKKLSDPQTTLMIFCNPHNPTGNIWDRETLIKVGELAHQYGVTVISDEIHCDLTDPGTEYIPFASVSELNADISITCIAPTKTFNMAGLQTSAAVIPNRRLRHKVWRALNTDECGEPGAFAVTAAVAAFNEGGEWLFKLRQYLYENKCLVRSYIAENIPQIKVVSGPATYLLWLDITALSIKSSELKKFIQTKTGLIITSGTVYGAAGEGFMRMNIACPRIRLTDGLDRLNQAVELLTQVS